MESGSPRSTAPDDVAEVAGVYERAAATYDRTGVEFFAPLGRRLVDSARPDPGHHVLDVGCGHGACTLPAAEAVGPQGRVTAIDAAPAMVRRTAELAAARGLHHVVVQSGDAMRPAFPPHSFDLVLAGLVVFLLPDPAAALGRYAHLLRPGGRLAMSSFGPVDPRFLHVTDALPAFLPDGLPDIPGRGQSPFGSKESLARLVAGAGFTGVDIQDVNLDLRFSGPGQWWDWLWQTGGRVVLEAVPPERLPDARAAAYRRMEEVRDEHGELTVRWNVWFTRATSRAR
ncbi:MULTISPECIES: methyltransferase domain-containing protein [Streptomyces]|uniref:Methyltransferase domain-containing protein n=1 Tax=Streptomyces luteosporeus TaxID=173856 RepID=A0ABN3TT37_9ACTN